MKTMKHNKGWILLLSMVFVVIGMACSSDEPDENYVYRGNHKYYPSLGRMFLQLDKKDNRFKDLKTIDELKTDVKNIEQTNKTLEKENKGIDTDEFKERIARERLGMIKEGEISLQEAKEGEEASTGISSEDTSEESSKESSEESSEESSKEETQTTESAGSETDTP